MKGIIINLTQLEVDFFWEGVRSKKKYHIIKFKVLAKPREHGCLGFIDTKAINIAC